MIKHTIMGLVTTFTLSACLAAPLDLPHKTLEGHKSTGTAVLEFLPLFSSIHFTTRNRVEAPTGEMTKTNPSPVTLHIVDSAPFANHPQLHVKDCRLIAEAWGDLSIKRILVRTKTLTCMINGESIAIPVKGLVSGEDGESGIKGQVLTLKGQAHPVMQAEKGQRGEFYNLESVILKPPLKGHKADKIADSKVVRLLPRNTFVPVTVESRIDVPTGEPAKSNPLSVAFHVLNSAHLAPQLDIKDCRFIAETWGDLSIKRILARTKTLTCMINGESIAIPVRGFINGENGELGIKGQVINLKGQVHPVMKVEKGQRGEFSNLEPVILVLLKASKGYEAEDHD